MIVMQADFKGMIRGFLAKTGSLLAAQQRQAFENYIDIGLLNLKRRLDTNPPQTILHFDPHFYNFLIPKEKDKQVLIVDWPNWQIGPGLHDLIYAMLFDRTTKHFVKHERPLIKCYQSALRGCHVNYPDSEFERDYPWALVRFLSIPVILSTRPEAEIVWQNMLPPLFEAIDRNDCWQYLI